MLKDYENIVTFDTIQNIVLYDTEKKDTGIHLIDFTKNNGLYIYIMVNSYYKWNVGDYMGRYHKIRKYMILVSTTEGRKKNKGISLETNNNKTLHTFLEVVQRNNKAPIKTTDKYLLNGVKIITTNYKRLKNSRLKGCN